MSSFSKLQYSPSTASAALTGSLTPSRLYHPPDEFKPVERVQSRSSKPEPFEGKASRPSSSSVFAYSSLPHSQPGVVISNHSPASSSGRGQVKRGM